MTTKANSPGVPLIPSGPVPNLSLKLGDLVPVLGTQSNLAFISRLASQGVLTLADIDRVGGVEQFASPSEMATAKLIDAHADLARVSSDLTANSKLIAAGYTSTLAIAKTPQSAFLKDATPILGQQAALRVQFSSGAIALTVNQMLAAALANANIAATAGQWHPNGLNGNSSQPCNCCDCQSAASPAAYLADLLSYVTQHVVNGGPPVELKQLQRIFCQPFTSLPTDCEAVEQQVRQVRICVEVLRTYIGEMQPSLSAAQLTSLAKSQSCYTLAAYHAILTGLGITYEQLRLARIADVETRIALAEQLGLTVDPYGANRPDPLDLLVLDPTASAAAAQAMTETNLELFFGLVNTAAVPLPQLADTLRNPLSDGPTSTPALITQWNLTGVSWGLNTDAMGLIYLSLVNQGGTQVRLDLYKDAARTMLVASSGLQALTNGIIAGSLLVTEENNSSLSGTFSIAMPSASVTLQLQALPLLQCWQLQSLRSEWLTEDHPADLYADGTSAVSLATLPSSSVFPSLPSGVFPPLSQGSIAFHPTAALLAFTGEMAPVDLALLLSLSADPAYTSAVKTLSIQSQRLPIVDPDIIGPDDFRNPFVSDAGFALWQTRRAWVDAQLSNLASQTKVVGGSTVPSIDGMLSVMSTPWTYGATTLTPWPSTAPSTSSFQTLWENLAEGAGGSANMLQIQSDLSLSIDSFNRLMNIWQTDQAAAIDPTSPSVTAAEWLEFQSILVQAAKSRLSVFWRNEESQLVFGSQEFLVSLREPVVGPWPLVQSGIPFIDPSLVALTDLPEPIAGAAAIALWNARATQVDQLTQNLRATRESLPSPQGLQAALQVALGDPNAGDALPVDLDTLGQQLLDPNPAVVAAATSSIQQSLFMSVSDFNQLMSIRAMDADPNPLDKPDPTDWLTLYGILTSAETQKRLYPTWSSQEAAQGLVYWSARKAALPLWRSDADTRAKWHAALALRSSAPIIDPDLISAPDFVNPVAGDPAYDLWSTRTTQVQTFLTPHALSDVSDVDAAVLSALGSTATDLLTLQQENDAGTDITARLAQLGLTMDGFEFLLGFRQLIGGSLPILQGESDDFWSILAQVQKERQFATWLQQETQAGITLGPDFFQYPPDSGQTTTDPCTAATSSIAPPTPPVLPEWRATAEARETWEDTLNARIEQQSSVISGIAGIVDSAEGATLAGWRDALVQAAVPGSSLSDAADTITESLLIDAEMGSCEKTTRIEQALETLQTLMTSIRDGQIASYGLTVDAPDFDQEWQWMSSYASWRSAILVGLYPENLLSPTLRKWQTPGFQKLVSDVQGNAMLTAAQAAEEACLYSQYFRDVCSINVETLCNALSNLDTDAGCTESLNPTDGTLLYMFGRAAATNTPYWSTYNNQDTSGYGQTFWDVVPGLTGQNLVILFGSTSFLASSYVPGTQRWVYLFFISSGQNGLNLCFTRYNPNVPGQSGWEGQVYNLALSDLPVPSSSFTAELGAQDGETVAPTIIVKFADGTVCQRQLNAQGTDWSNVPWTIVSTWHGWTKAIDANVSPAGPGAGPGQYIADALAVVSPGPDLLVLLWIDPLSGGSTGQVKVSLSTEGSLSTASTIGNVTFGSPNWIAAVARDPTHIDVFVSDQSASSGSPGLFWCAGNYSNGQWQWPSFVQVHGLKPSGVVVAVARTADRLDLFAINSDDSGVWWNTWDGQWHQWAAIGNNYVDSPYATNLCGLAAVARGQGHLDVFMIDSGGDVCHNSWDANNPFSSAWETIGTANASSLVTAVTRTPSRVDVFWLTDGPSHSGEEFTQWNWADFNQDSGGWHSAVTLNENLPQVVAAGAAALGGALGRTPTHLDVFINTALQGPGGSVFHPIRTTWQDDNAGATWQPWLQIGTPLASAPTEIIAVSSVPSRIDLFIYQAGKGIYTAYWPDLSSVNSMVDPPPPYTPARPSVLSPLDVPFYLSSSDLQARRTAIAAAFQEVLWPPSNLEYLREAYYFVPVYLADQLRQQGLYEPALDLFRTVYDYSTAPSERNIYYGFDLEASFSAVWTRPPDWLLDPLNPHLIAATRQYAYLRYTILTLAQCFSDYADSRFTYDTSESDAQARTLYMTELALLGLNIFVPPPTGCTDLIIQVQAALAIHRELQSMTSKLLRQLSGINDVSTLTTLVPSINTALAGDASPTSRLTALRTLISKAARQLPAAPAMGQLLAQKDSAVTSAYRSLLADPVLGPAVNTVASDAGATFNSDVSSQGGFSPGTKINGAKVTPAISFGFCIPPNPLVNTMQMHAELCLYELRNCMNIAGIARQVAPYSASTSVSSGLPSIGAAGNLLIPSAVVIQPTPYSYSVLIARAQQLVQIATQMEAAMLSALEKRDQGTYDQLQAQQHLALAQQTVQLQQLTVTQASDGLTLAQLQQQKATTASDYWQQMLNSDVSSLEQQALSSMQAESDLQIASSATSELAASMPSADSVFSFGSSNASNLASALSSLAASMGTSAQMNQAQASLEVQQDDWQFQYSSSLEDGQIAAQQITGAQDQVRIAAQQLSIAQLQSDQAEAGLSFLVNEFTNAALYDWMSTVLLGVYSYFLQQATATARLAENQMAFERQIVPPGFIQADYWQAPSTGSSTSTPTNTDGLTGAERLTEDIATLDQYYFTTDQRKLQLTKTISLSQYYPLQLQQLRDTGTMNFATTLSQFDQDFPGHYMRLIQQVRVSVIALIPPAQNINATLSTNGVTRTVVGPDVFQKIVVSRDPESIAITSPTNATGVFTIDPQANLRLPFQGLGVEANWEFDMPQASNPFDFTTIADVQLSIDYTALNSNQYRAQVLQTLNNQTTGEQSYSFVNNFADQWYDLNNPDQTATPMSVQFNTSASDYPPNLSNIQIQQVLLYFSRSDGASFEVAVSAFQFTEGTSTSTVGGSATTTNGIISTRGGNGFSWLPMIGKQPFGTWQLTLPNTATLRNWFTQGQIEDILLVITYSGDTPPRAA
jgi:hypothetical protein